MVFRGANKGITKLKGNEMKFKIGKTEIMIVEWFNDVVRCLYGRSTDVSLLHADIETSESSCDTEKTGLQVQGTFSVSLTPIIKVEFLVDATFTKSNSLRNAKWCRPMEFSVRHNESGLGVTIDVIHNEMRWEKSSHHAEERKAFAFMIGRHIVSVKD
jgi:hypothetical protein